MNKKRLQSLMVGLAAVLFFFGTGGAGDPSAPSGQVGNPAAPAPITIAKTEVIIESPLKHRPDYKENLKKVMEEVFKVITLIVEDPQLTVDEKKLKVMEYIRTFRYGRENKDSFWINDMKPVMLVDAYRQELEGQNVAEYMDPNGRKVFVEIVKVCGEDGEGFITYLWPKYEQMEWNHPNVSFVKLLKDWNWAIGTRFFLELIEVHDMPAVPVVDDREAASPT
jgi:signal transduction histidine kinase